MTTNQIIAFFAILALIAVLGTGAKDNPILGWVLIAAIVADFVWAWQVTERAPRPRPMRVRIDYAVEVDDDFRRAIRRYYGQDRLATRQEVVAWFRTFGESMNDDLGLGEPDES